MDDLEVTHISVKVRDSIVLNLDGKEFRYRSVDEMPPEHRKLWEQAQGALNQARHSGKPQLAADAIQFGGQAVTNFESSQSIVLNLNGKEFRYGSVDEMPPEHRERWQEAQAAFEEGRSTGNQQSSATTIHCGDELYKVVDEFIDPKIRDRATRKLVRIAPAAGGQAAGESVVECPECLRRVRPKKGWFGRKKCPRCGIRLK